MNWSMKEDLTISFDSSTVPSEQEWDNFNGLEEILLIGYPHWIMNVTNNFPIFSGRHTATHHNIDYNGMKEFLVNAKVHACSSRIANYPASWKFY